MMRNSLCNMLPRNIPEDINVELLLSYFPEGSCKVALKGLHKRNSYNDIIDIEEKRDGSLLLGIGRNSLYNSLPEFMFHPIDRFDNIPKIEERERLAEEYQKQEKEKENAYRFFAPIDLLLLQLRVKVRDSLSIYYQSNKVLIDIIGDELTDEQTENCFIRQTLKYLPLCKNIRGNKTLLTFMLCKIFMEEGLKIDVTRKTTTFTDKAPRYSDGLDSAIGESYVGNVFDEESTLYDIHYWSEDDCNENFMKFVEDVEQYRLFLQDNFLSIEDTLHFNICKDDALLRLSDDIIFNYLNYNTNL